MAAFKLRQSAESDLVAIGIESRELFGEAQMRRYIGQLDSAFHTLAEAPRIAREVDEVKPSMRRFPQGSHLIFYGLTEAGDADIVRILHASLDHEVELEDEDDLE
jgi:toxin ParE1/3/4